MADILGGIHGFIKEKLEKRTKMPEKILEKRAKYSIPAAFVFHSGNVSVKDKITYYPIYMMMFLREPELEQGLTYTPDFGVLMG